MWSAFIVFLKPEEFLDLVKLSLDRVKFSLKLVLNCNKLALNKPQHKHNPVTPVVSPEPDKVQCNHTQNPH